MTRYFVAVSPPDSVKDEIAALPRPELKGVRWTRRDQWHVTLAFLGDVDESAVVEALGGVESALVQAELGPEVGTIRRDVVVIPASGLDELAETVLEAVRPLAPDLPRRRFRGHLTLARCRGDLPLDIVGLAFHARFEVGEFRLVHSELNNEGAIHTDVATFRLGTSGAA